ncbi:MAG TPA: hypothetical protein VF596_08580 [Pyrinomonadaceae bacterium]|jgi:hypothetical protein
MTQTRKYTLAFCLAIVSFWDLVTTIYGTHSIAGDTPIQIGIAVGFGLLLSALLLYTLPIVKNPKEDVFSISFKGIWFLGLLYDLYTAFMGNFNLLLSSVNDTPKIVLAVGLTIFTCYAPLYLSKIIFDEDED